MKWIWPLVLAAAGVPCGTARAADPDPPAAGPPVPAPSDVAALDAALLDADRRFVGGDLEGALGVLGPACSGSERPDCAFSLGAVEHGLGHCEQALAHYRKYRELAPQGEHIAEVTAALEEVESRCGESGGVPAAPVTAALSAAPAPTGASDPAPPAASSPSRAAVPAPESGTATAAPRPHTELMLGSFVLSGAAALGSVVFGILAAQTAHDCAQPRVYDQSFIEQCEEQGPSYQALWQGFAVASGGLLGMGLTVWWLDSRAAASVGVSGAGGPTLEVQGRF